MTKYITALLFFAFLFSAQAQQSFLKPTPIETEPTLKSLLDAQRTKLEAKLTSDEKKIIEEGITDIIEKGVFKRAKTIKTLAPKFELQNVKEEKVSLAELLKQGPVVLTWYRGGWSSYCDITLNELQKHLKEFKINNATLIALSPERPDKRMETKKKNKLDFELLWDVENKVAAQYNVVYKLSPDVAKMYEKEVNLQEYNKSQSSELPLTATYVIDKNGIIRYAFVTADYRERAEPSAILAILKRLR